MTRRRDILGAVLGAAVLLLAVCTVALIWIGPQKPRLKVLLVVDGALAENRALAAGVAAAAEGAHVELHVESLDRSANAEATSRGSAILARIERHNPQGVILGTMRPLTDFEEQEFAGLNPWVHIVACQPEILPTRRRLQVGSSDLALGRMGAALVRSLHPPGGAVAVVLDKHSLRHRERIMGFEDAITGALPSGNNPPCTIVGRIAVSSADPGESIEAMLAAHPEIGSIVCFSADQSTATAQLLAARRHADPQSTLVRIVAFEPTDATYDELAAGRIDAIVVDSPYAVGAQAVKSMAALCEATVDELPAPGHGLSFVRPQVVTRENVARFRAQGMTGAG